MGISWVSEIGAVREVGCGGGGASALIDRCHSIRVHVVAGFRKVLEHDV